MKRNFLLMLLLTLLPFAGWAVDVPVGEYTVNLDKQYIAVGNTVPTVKGVTKGGNSVSFSQISVVKSDKVTEVASITLPGIYYKVVKANVSADTYDKLLVPFYAGEPMNFDFIWNKETFDQSVTSGALKLYYEEYNTGDFAKEADINAAEGQGGWTYVATNSTEVYENNPYNGLNGGKHGFPQIAIKAPEQGSFFAAFSYTGDINEANVSTVPAFNDFVGENKLCANPWGTTKAWGQGEGERKWGLASFNAMYGTGQIYYDATDKEDKRDAFYNFDPEKFSAFWIPSDLNLASADVAVAPVTFSKIKIMARVFHVPFGTDVTGNDVTPDMFTILSVGAGICSEVELAASGLLKFVYLDGENTKVSIYGHPFKIEYNGEPFEYTTTSGAENVTTTYEIVVVTDQNTMYFDATPNSFMEGQIPTVVSGDLTYNAEAQNLISSTGKTMFVHADETASNVKYLVVTADKVIPDNGEAIAPIEPIPAPEPGPAPEPQPDPQPGTDEPEQPIIPEKFKLNYEPAASEWTDDATKTDVAYAGEGNGREVDYYYVFAKASAGIGEAEGWTEGKTVEYIGKVKIKKATPVLEMTGIDETYYIKSKGTTTNGLHKALTPEVTVKVASGKKDADNKPLYNTLTAGNEYKAEDISVIVCTGPTWSPQYYLKDFKCSTVGGYRITSAIAANDNLNELNKGQSLGFVDFQVVRPKVYVPITVDDVPFATAATPVPGTPTWEPNGDSYDEVLVGDRLWYYLTDENGNIVWRDGDGNYPAGSWILKPFAGLTVKQSNAADAPAGDHEIVYRTAPINIGRPDIVAKIENADLVYGQALPIKLTHVDGLTGDAAAETFEEKTDWEFSATLVNKDSHEPILDKNGNPQVTPIPVPDGGLLNAGTYKVTCSGATFNMPYAQNTFNVIVGAGYWTVAPKKLDNSDFKRGVVANIEGYWNRPRPSVTYTGEPVYPEQALAGITYLNRPLVADEPAVPAVLYTADDAEVKAGTKNVGDVKTEAKPAVQHDYSITVLSDAGNINAGRNIRIQLTGHGNYQLTQTLGYNIDKKEIIVLPVAKVDDPWVCGSDEEDEDGSIYAINWVDLFGKLVEADQAKEAFKVEVDKDGKIKTNKLKSVDGFSALKVRRLTGPNVGTFPNGIEAYLPEDADPKAQNYDFIPGTAAIKITPGTIALKVKQDMTAVYAGKEAYPLTTGDFVLDEEHSTLGEFYVQDDNWRQLVNGIQTLNALTWTLPELPADKRFDVGDPYVISIDREEATKLSSTNYTIVITPDAGKTYASANVTITKAPIELTVADLGSETSPILFDNLGTAFATYAGTTDGVDHVTISTVEGKKLRGLDVKEDLISEVTYDDDDLTVGENEDALYVVGTSLYSNNYTPTENKGTIWLTYATNLELTSVMADNVTYDKDGKETARVANDWSKLLAHDGKPVKKITLQLKPATMEGKPAFSQWNEDEWHAMVLPFAVTVKELSQAFDFAYINIVDPTKTTENNVQFKVPNILDEIPANVPFCIKSSVPYKYAVEDDPDTEANEAEVGDVLTFERKGDKFFEVNLTGVDEDWMVEGVDAGMGYKFAGTYAENFAIDKTKSELRFINNKWYFIKSNSDKVYNMPPYTGFANLGVASSTREVTFTFEEEDGSTTAIKAVDFFNGNKANAEGVYRVDGVKMNTAPTQRGVYIQDGKKFVK